MIEELSYNEVKDRVMDYVLTCDESDTVKLYELINDVDVKLED